MSYNYIILVMFYAGAIHFCNTAKWLHKNVMFVYYDRFVKQKDGFNNI